MSPHAEGTDGAFPVDQVIVVLGVGGAVGTDVYVEELRVVADDEDADDDEDQLTTVRVPRRVVKSAWPCLAL